MTDGLGGATWDFDAAGRTVSATDSLGRTLHYGHDPVGNRVSMTFPSGDRVEAAYDDADRPANQTTPWGGATFAFDAAGNLLRQATTGGGTTAYSYDAADRLVMQASSGISGAGTKDDTAVADTPPPDVPVRVAYAYDAVGSVTTRDQELARTVEASRYSYDALRRLVRSETNGAETRYAYDAVGNRIGLQATDNPFTPKPSDPLTQQNSYDAANRLTKVVSAIPDQRNLGSTDSLTYDANGNRTKLVRKPDKGNTTSTTYGFDVEGRLSLIEAQNRSLRFSYDGHGRRLREEAGTGASRKTTEVLFDDLDPILTSDIQNGHQTSFVRRTDGNLLLQHETVPDRTHWYLNDGLNSVTGLVRDGGHLADTAAYTDFGSPSLSGGYSSRFAFTGEQWDGTFRLSHYYARSYDPANGTWLQPDSYRGTLDQPSTLHRFSYVTNNPATYLDAYGYTRVQALQVNALMLRLRLALITKGNTASTWPDLAGSGGTAWTSLRLWLVS